MIARILIQVSCALLCAIPPARAQDSSRKALRTAVDRVLAEAEAAGVRTGVVVLDFPTQEVWLRRRARESFIPASNQKLITAAAALHSLGQGFQFETVFELRAGVLVVHPSADPNWITGSDHDPRRLFGQVAEWLHERGVSTLRGIHCAEGVFGGDRRPAGWPRDQSDRTYCAPGGPFVLEAGCFWARIEPVRGRTAKVRVVAPPGLYAVRGKGMRMTTDKKKGSVYGVRQKAGSITPLGSFWTKSNPVTVRASIDDPAAAFERALRAVLSEAGIQCGTAELRGRIDLAKRDDALLLRIRTSLVEALAAVLAESSNTHAEQVLRAVGAARIRDGSIPGGCRAVGDALGEFLGPDSGLPTRLEIVDGSGLSRGNQVSPELLVEVLACCLQADFAVTFLDSLAQGGIRGTLKRRFRDEAMRGRVRGKTGTINRVSALSGVIRDGADRLQVFSILMNVDRKGAKVRSRTMRRWQDRIATAIANVGR